MWQFEVPNAPCGVESEKENPSYKQQMGVPNAPCGVESSRCPANKQELRQFLMHRVELKDSL